MFGSPERDARHGIFLRVLLIGKAGKKHEQFILLNFALITNECLNSYTSKIALIFNIKSLVGY